MSRISQDSGSDASCGQAISLVDAGGDQTPRLHYRGKTGAQLRSSAHPFDSYEDSPAPASTCSSEHPTVRSTAEDEAPPCAGGHRHESDVSVHRPLFADPRTWASIVSDALVLVWVVLTHLIFTSWPYTSLYFMFASVLLHWKPGIYFCLFMMATSLLPKCEHSLRIISIFDALFFRFWRRHVSYRVTYDAAIRRDQQYIVAEYPHGVFPLAGQMHASIWSTLHTTKMNLLAANVLLMVPLWRHYMSACGVSPATKGTIEKLLAKGNSLAVHVGGIAEMFMTHSDREAIMLQNRRGFIKIAVEHGIPVIPMYHFGNSQLMRFVPRFLQSTSRKLRTSLGIFVGQMGLPIPVWAPLWTVAGAPLDMGPGMLADDVHFHDVVEAKHAEFTAALTALYEQHRGDFFDGRKSWADRPLHVM